MVFGPYGWRWFGGFDNSCAWRFADASTIDDDGCRYSFNFSKSKMTKSERQRFEMSFL
jgi:hypothetical protein